MTTPLEKVIQAKIVRWLRDNGWLVWKNQAGPYGSAGIPDLTAIRDGLVLYIETKRPGARLTKLQAAVIDDINAHGVTAGKASSIEDVNDMIRSAMVMRRGPRTYEEAI